MNALHSIRKTLFPCALALFILLAFAAFARAQSAAPMPAPSVAGLNVLLAQLDQTAQTTNLDLAKLRIEKWKTNGDVRQQLQSNADSLSRNLTGALPAIVGGVRSSPENLAANFKLYRNVDALYDVLSALTDVASNSAPRGDYQALATDVSNLEVIRRALADRIEAMAAMRDAALARGPGGTTASAKSGKSGVKKIVIDDSAPAKSTTHKKKPATTTPPQ
ncbi:MAG: hypothetical protein HYX28_00800 [Candidatus Koribacter versatilis]|uniref:Uncharacterized protein n=1 Tax=Candidatus Korobacter versatilis TaxID=658062 RepID=A0A932A5Z4_9BACT|nr:hypothetical protein [Candidatus Koribacter versatilis]